MWTRAAIETAVVARTAGMLSACYISSTPITDASPRAYMNDPLRTALRDLGYSILDPTAVADADFQSLDPTDENPLLRVAELRTLESCFGSLDDVAFSQGPEKIAGGELGVRLEKRIEKIRENLKVQYGLGLQAPVMGVIRLNTLEQIVAPFGSTVLPQIFNTE